MNDQTELNSIEFHNGQSEIARMEQLSRWHPDLLG